VPAVPHARIGFVTRSIGKDSVMDVLATTAIAGKTEESATRSSRRLP
jgi:hypothetical protein